MKKIRFMFFIAIAVLFGFYGNVYALPTYDCNCTSCHGNSRPSQCAPVNVAPVANAGTDQSVDEGLSVTLNGANSSDADNNMAFYFWEQTGGPEVTLSDSNAVRPNFIAPAVSADGESLTFRLTVTDDAGAEDTDTCIVNVSWINEAPAADAGSDQTVDEGVVVTLDGSNSIDPDDGIAAYSWRQVGPSTVTLSNKNAVDPTFEAPFVDLGSLSLTFELTVTDAGGLQSTDTTVINVSWVDEAPTADAGTDQTVDPGETVTLDASNSSDPDDGIASYRWTQVGATSGSSAILSDPTAIRPTFEAPATGTEDASLTFQVTVTDKEGLQATDTCIVNVNAIISSPVNEAPTANAGDDQTVDEGDVVTLDASDSSDGDEGIASYLWTQTGTDDGISVTLSDPAAVQPTFEAPAVGPQGASLTFQVTVTDIGGLQSSDTCIVNVNAVEVTPVNAAPTADAGNDQTVDPGNVVTLNASGSNDPEGVVASYMWKQTGGMSVTLSDPSAVDPTFDAPMAGAALTFEVTVMDIDGLQDTDSCVINVNAVENPDTGNQTPPASDVENDDTADEDRYENDRNDDDDREQPRYDRTRRYDRDDRYDRYRSDDREDRYTRQVSNDRDDTVDRYQRDDREERYTHQASNDRDDAVDRRRSESRRERDDD